MIVSRWMVCAGLGTSAASLAGAAAGQPLPPITIACEPLDVERTAQVEARVRALLLTTRVPVTEVSVICSGDQAGVAVKTATAAAGAEVGPTTEGIEARLVEAVDRALAELGSSGDGGGSSVLATTPISAQPGADSSPPAAPALPPPRLPPPVAPASSRGGRPGVNGNAMARPRWELGAGGTLERWSAGSVVGGSARAGYGGPALRVGVAIGAGKVAPSADAFRAREMNASLALGWEPPWAWGLRGEVRLGISVLSVTPEAAFNPRGGTTTSAGFAELAFLRPIRLSSTWAVAPRVFARGWGARRHLTVDGEEALVVSGLTPGAGLELLYRAP